VLTEHLGWRYIFFLNVPAGIIVLILTFWKLRGEWAGAKGEPFDLVGSLIYGGGVVCAMYGFTRMPDLLGIGLFILGLLALAGFVMWELRVKSPVLNIDLFRKNQVFAFSNLAALVNYLGSSSIAFLLSLYLLYVKGLPPTLAGLVLIAQPIIMAVFSPLAGKLSDKFEPRVVASIGMAITALGLALLVFVDDLDSVFYIIDCLLILGFGLALFSSPNTNAIMGCVERRSYGVASATLATMRLTGQMLSMTLATLILAIYIGHEQITVQNQSEFVLAMRLAFAISAALCVAGIFFSLRRGKVHG
jgi:MFS family permease